MKMKKALLPQMSTPVIRAITTEVKGHGEGCSAAICYDSPIGKFCYDSPIGPFAGDDAE